MCTSDNNHKNNKYIIMTVCRYLDMLRNVIFLFFDLNG
jgi:hypothetical protein